MQVDRRYVCASAGEAGVVSAGSVEASPSSWFGPRHLLASVAAQRCLSAGHRFAGRRGVVACGACWERAIRDDERFASECGLPDLVGPDPGDVDEIAVERACSGDRSVSLTRHEVWAAVARLQRQGLDLGQIATRLHREATVVRRILAGLAAGAAA
jgi:hypothetical protein